MAFMAAIGSGLVAGIFFAFSNFVMAALGRLAPEQGISAMQSIDVTVYNASFMLILLGTGVISLGLAVGSFAWFGRLEGKLLLVSALTYIVGCIGVTAMFNLPLNELLAGVEVGSNQGTRVWSRFLSEWTFWNHIRTAGSLITAIGLTFFLARRAPV